MEDYPRQEKEAPPLEAAITVARRELHAALLAGPLSMSDTGVASIADSGSKQSVALSRRLVEQLGLETASLRGKGQTAGAEFETQVAHFLRGTFSKLSTIRCGNFIVQKGSLINNYQQFEHLSAVAEAARINKALRVALGFDYLVRPDVVIIRHPMDDDAINSEQYLINDDIAKLTPIRSTNNKTPILHASISCKWTIRSDRAQNTRSEFLNLIRNRKGHLPHAAIVTAEPLPSRLASLAMGTGDIDCVYHFALWELRQAAIDLGFEESLELLDTMIDGNRLRDIADLPLDLAI